MSQRIKFFLAQILWVFLAFLMALAIGPDNPEMVIFPIAAMFVITGFLLNWGKNQENQGNGDNVLVRSGITGIMWLIYVGAVLAGAMELGAVIIPLAVILMIPLLALNAFMWGIAGRLRELRMTDVAQTSTEIEKRKRERLDKVIRDLSDEDLLRLKHRLMNREVMDEDLEYMLGDDGELVPMEDKRRR
jgi:hypothetical protein